MIKILRDLKHLGYELHHEDTNPNNGQVIYTLDDPDGSIIHITVECNE